MTTDKSPTRLIWSLQKIVNDQYHEFRGNTVISAMSSTIYLDADADTDAGADVQYLVDAIPS